MMAAKKKLQAEAGLTEEKIILGWKWDFGLLIISLPFNKYSAWSANIMTMITAAEVSTISLESNIG